MSAPLAIQSVNHISHVTRDVEASAAFYRDVLGFRQLRRPNFPFPGAWLYNYGVQIHLIGTGSGSDEHGEISTRADHVAFHVDDIEAAEQALKEKGIPYRSNFVADTGVTQIFFHDPDGNHIEIGTYPPPVELSGD